MQAVVIAAGQGTRMGPLTDGLSKPMLPIGGQPIVEHVLDEVAPYVEEFVVVVGYEASQITEHFGDEHHGVPIEYVTQDEQLGTAHAIQQAQPHIDEAFLALNGDVYLTPELVADLAAAEITAMAVKPVEDPRSYGVVDIDDSQITSIVEKPDDPPTNLANLGLYRFTPEIFKYIDETERSERGEYEITDSLQHALDDGQPVTAVEYDGPWLDIGRPWELLEATEHILADLQRDIRGDVEPNATITGPVVVEEGARVRNGAYIEGPVIVQAGADVGPNAYVRGSTVIGPDVRVGNAVEVKNSIIMADTAVSHLSYVGDSVLGRDVNFGAGTKVANLRHDDQPVQVQVKGEMVDTGRRKFGVVVGHNTKTGINTSLNAGVTLGTDTRTLLGEAVEHDKNRS
ncbi:sugar phosphate nucleotidyltransferase [Halobacterium salinarum]|uniref:bifunctional sugar-1-phosphate nucleotidylyltransferase/acetyltransferase n=1 Tax=Halobacterium salinarum TaxID=2242 RepID=UPI002556ED3B|nr:bifunctional sugar-1-phosphate nucleotidylyltransferase/acetyltransferase [Halobacterium salinarum]MDL0118496.1 sugar phosphate nucleotidyltransferase [Halobacterium salinarum]MDL0118709.1 sugar phosphate nucleotidyltransferase [Halobacterium salinarum]MDL0118779.1 sugar phosphate nucleotidyltransferase [Halobacterium salinarum]